MSSKSVKNKSAAPRPDPDFVLEGSFTEEPAAAPESGSGPDTAPPLPDDPPELAPELAPEFASDPAPEPAPEPAAPPRRSLTFRLRWLGFALALGAVLALWAGPRLAPLLPVGLAPVAAWLSPGGAAARAELAAAVARLDARIDALPPVPESGALVQAALAGLDPELQALETRLAEVESRPLAGPDPALAALSGTVAALRAEVDALTLLPEAAPGTTDAVAPAAPEIQKLTARLAGLEARLATAESALRRLQAEGAAAQAALTARIAEAAAAEDDHTAARAAIRAALDAGLPYASELARLGLAEGASPGLTGPSATGVASLAALRETFPEAAHAAIRAEITAASGSGMTARLWAYLRAQAAARSLSPLDGADADAVLSRVEEALRLGDLTRALELAGTLEPAPAAALAPWAAAAAARLGALDALQALEGP